MSPLPEDHPMHIAMRAKGWILEDLSQAAGCSKPLLSNTQRGYLPKLATRERIAKALDTTPEKLWPEHYPA